MVAIKNRRIPKRIEQFPHSSEPTISFKCEAISVDAVTSAPVWRISRIVELGGARVETLFAGKGIFDQICDDRETLFPALPFINAKSTEYDGVAGEAVAADGSVLSFENTQPFTMTSWIKPFSATGTIIDKQDSSLDFRGYGFLIVSQFIQITLRNNLSGNEISVRSFLTVDLNEWNSLIVTYDGSKFASGIQLYHNGVLLAKNVITNDLTGSIVNTKKFRIGRREAATVPFDGRIDETGIFFKELTSLEVTEIFNSGVAASLQDHSRAAFLEGNWHMGDNNLFPVLDDNSGNGNDLTILNLPAGAIKDDPAVII